MDIHEIVFLVGGSVFFMKIRTKTPIVLVTAKRNQKASARPVYEVLSFPSST